MYLAELSRRGHAGRLLGVDLSPGMLHAAAAVAPDAAPIVADATRLPLADAAADVVLAPHMLYHVPDPAAAVREFRRVTRPSGQALVVLNADDHLAELRELVTGTAAELDDLGWWGLTADQIGAEYRTYLLMTLDAGAELLGRVFGTVVRHEFVAELVLPGPQPVAGYVASMRATQAMPDSAGFVAAVTGRIPFGPDGTFRVRTHPGLLICS
jgi:SAM-dependent methyltransferase